MHFLRAQSPGRQRNVDGHVPAPDNDDLASHLRGFPNLYVSQEIPPPENTFLFRPFQGNPCARIGSARKEDCIMFLLQFIQGDVLAYPRVALKLYAPFQNGLDVSVQPFLREPVVRNSVAQHAARLRKGVAKRHLVPLGGEIIGGGQPGRPGTHDRHFLAGPFRHLLSLFPCVAPFVHCGSLNRPDGNGVSKLLVSTDFFAGRKTSICADGGERELFSQDRHRLIVFAVSDGADIPGHIYARRASIGTSWYDEILSLNTHRPHCGIVLLHGWQLGNTRATLPRKTRKCQF